MKKIFCIIALFISVIAFGQTNVSEARDNFKDGCFWFKVNDDSEVFLKAVYETINWDRDDNVTSAEFITTSDFESYAKGEEWFKGKMKTEDGNMAMFNYLYETYGFLMEEGYVITDDGHLRVKIFIGNAPQK